MEMMKQRFASARSLLTATAAHPSSPTVVPVNSSSSTYPDPPEPVLTAPIVSRYLFFIGGLVFAIVVVGGMTRLTESGLSITEWNVIKGVQLPLTQAEWQEEFDKYRLTPEFKMCVSNSLPLFDLLSSTDFFST